MHQALFDAVREMREIDNSFGGEKWGQAMQHLAIRRLMLGKTFFSSKIEQKEQLTLFLSTDKPTFSDYLDETKNDVQELLALLQMAWLNELDKEFIKQKLKETDIDLSQVIETTTQLRNI